MRTYPFCRVLIVAPVHNHVLPDVLCRSILERESEHIAPHIRIVPHVLRLHRYKDIRTTKIKLKQEHQDPQCTNSLSVLLATSNFTSSLEGALGKESLIPGIDLARAIKSTHLQIRAVVLPPLSVHRKRRLLLAIVGCGPASQGLPIPELMSPHFLTESLADLFSTLLKSV